MSNPLSFLGNRVGQFAENVRAATQSATSGLRKEVPFERWYFHYGQANTNKVEPRFWALASACESVVRVCAAAATYVFSLVFNSKQAPHHLDVLKTQGQSLSLSLLAVASPNAAKERAHGHIGQSLLNWKWGTLYKGN